MKVGTRPTVQFSFSPLVSLWSIDGSIKLDMLKLVAERISNIEADVLWCHRVRCVKKLGTFTCVCMCVCVCVFKRNTLYVGRSGAQ